MTDATNVLVITDPETGEVLRVVVPDSDEQLETATFHSDDEVGEVIPMDTFLSTPDLRQLRR